MSLPPDLRDRLVLPAMVAPMFRVSGTALIVESCKAGVIGTLTRNHCRSDAEFEQQLATVSEARARASEHDPARRIGPLAANVSVNIGRDARDAALDACRRHGVDLIVTAGGAPLPVVEAAGTWGARVFHDVTTLPFAERAMAAGVRGLIAIGSGGGGHSGTLSPLVLAPRRRAMFGSTIVLAGAIATGAAIRAEEILGANLAYLGTRYIATRESVAPPGYKEMLVGQSVADLIYSGQMNGVPAMWLKQSLRERGLDPDDLIRRGSQEPSRLPPDVNPWINLWSAGQAIGLIDDIPSVADQVRRLRQECVVATQTPAMMQAGE